MLFKRLISLCLFIVVFALIFKTTAYAGPEEYRLCPLSDSCSIGEFLYDDEYTPITTATCTLTSRNPSGSLYLDDVTMASESDGWYSLGVTTASQAEGLYRSQMCCTIGTEYICIDKSFVIGNSLTPLTATEVENAVWDTTAADHLTAGTFGKIIQESATLTASDIWDYPDRSLSSFGTLVADVWGYSSRSMTSVSSIITGVWDHSDRELTTSTTTETNRAKSTETNTNTLISKTNDLSKEIATNRALLEQLVNKPIIETFIEEKAEPKTDFQTKIKKTREIADSLSAETISLKRQVTGITSDWNSSSSQIALAELSTASRVLGASTTDEDNENKNIVSKIGWLNKSWKSDLLSHLSDQAASAMANTNNMSREVRSAGKTTVSKQYLALVSGHLNKLQASIGEKQDEKEAETLYGLIKQLEKTHQSMIDLSQEIDDLFAFWDSYSPKEIDGRLAQIKTKVLSQNQIPQAEQVLALKEKNSMHRENLALALDGLIQSNLSLLAQDADETVRTIWLEHGSIIFRSLVTNPSSTISQTVPIKYYLPFEVQENNIIQLSEGLSVSYDAEKDAIFVSGEVSLGPNETQTFTVEVEDVWIIPDDQIASLRKQTMTLFQPLKNTSYFAQGSTIKADIDVSLDKIDILQRDSHTPETKIKAYRQARVELEAAKDKLADLKTLVSSAGSIGTVFGFVGGVQTLAVWGLIIILIAGFVFLALYMRLISPKARKTAAVKGKKIAKEKIAQTEKEILKNIASKPDKSKKITGVARKFLNFKVNLGVTMLISILLIGLVFIIIKINSSRNTDLVSPISAQELKKNALKNAPDLIIEQTL